MPKASIDFKYINPRLKSNKGFSIIEVLCALCLFMVMGLGLTYNSIYALKFQKNAELANLATNLAVTKAEELAGVDASTLSSGNNSTETGLTVTGHKITFNRSTTITVNADGSRTVVVLVSSPSPFLLKSVSYSTRLAPWES